MGRSTGIRITNGFEPELNIVKNSDGKIETGLVVGNTLEQNQALILLCHKGENKEFLQLGAGIEDMLNDNDFGLWKRRIIYMLSLDGMKVKELEINDKEIRLEADYE